MGVVDLHPDELIDRAARGTLSTDERARLDAHLAGCVACRFEIKARDDFSDDLADEPAPPARPLEPSLIAHPLEATPHARPLETPLLRRLLEPALLARSPKLTALAGSPEPAAPARPLEPFVEAPPLPPPAGATLLVGPPSRRYRPGPFLIAATLLAAGVASAAGAFDLLRPAPLLPALVAAQPTPVAPSLSSTLASAPPRSASSPASALASSAPASASPPPAVASSSPEAPSSQAHVLAFPREKGGTEAASSRPPSTPRAKVEAPTGALPTETAKLLTSAAAPAEAKGAAPLFAEANEARRRGEFGRALALYRELDLRFRASPEAQVARATSGRLLLERGDAAGALDRFDAYLRSGGGPLSEEIMAGRALALGRLGRESDEADAWASLLRRHPGSAHAPRAEARLRALGAR